LEALRGQRAELEEKMQAVRAKLVPADQMIGLLRNLLHQDGRLELVSLRTLAVVPVALRRDREKPNDLPLEGTQALYRHAVELKLRGRYAAIHDYLARLENIGRRLYWDEMRLAAKYPVSTLTLTLHTLSLEEAWLSL
jgi:MSHA biogenesis protein MshJ